MFLYNHTMKTILVDAVYTFVSETGEIDQALYALLEKYSNPKVIVTNAPLEKFEGYGLRNVPYEVFTLEKNPSKTNPQYFETLLKRYELTPDQVIYFEHSPEAVASAQSVDITAYHFDAEVRDLDALKNFIDGNV